MYLLNVESYVFIDVFYLVLFCIHVCVDDVIKEKPLGSLETFEVVYIPSLFQILVRGWVLSFRRAISPVVDRVLFGLYVIT